VIVVVLEGFALAPSPRKIVISLGIAECAAGRVFPHDKPSAFFIDKSVKREVAIIDFRNAIPVGGLTLVGADAAATQVRLDLR